MSQMQNCPSCGVLLAERGFFCASCAMQVRCKDCRELLEKDARACVMCGATVGAGAAGNGTNGNAPRMNTLELQEDTRSRSLRISFTDTAIGSVGDTVNQLLSDKLASHGRRTLKTGDDTHVQPMLPPAQGAGTTGQPLDLQHQMEAKPVAQLAGDAERLGNIFEPDGEDFKLEENRLKADSSLEYARRLSYLFLYAHELHGRKPIPVTNLRKILDASKVWDNNTRHELRQKMAVEIDGDNIRLKKAGRERAIQVLNEILDINHADPGWTPESKTKAVKPGRDTKETRPTGRVGRKRSQLAEEWAGKWEKHTDHIDGHFILKDKTILDKAILALWAIHKVGGKAASGLYLQRFIVAAFSLNEKERSIKVTLKRETAKDFVIKTEDGYKLTPSGTKRAEQLSKATKQ